MEIRTDTKGSYSVFQKYSHYMNINVFQVIDETLVLMETYKACTEQTGCFKVSATSLPR